MVSKIKVDVHRGKLLTFELEIANLNYRELDAKFEIDVNGIVYGFEGNLTSEQVDIHIPCLSDVVHDILKYENKGQIPAKLIVYGDHFYQVPWEGHVIAETPGKIKAKVKKTSPKKVKEETNNEMEEQQEVIVDDPETEVSLPKPKEKDKKKELKPQTESLFINESTKYEYLQKLKKIDEKGIRAYMARAGTRSAHIQNIILEQAENTCRNPEDKFELLKSVVKVMSKIKKPEGLENL